jgi:phage pi2 protein 07
LTTKIVRKKVYKNPDKDGRTAHWHEDQKAKAITLYLSIGNLAEVARRTEIPEQTLRNWKQMDWWKEAVEDIKKEKAQALSGKLSNVVEKSLATVEDRLENGDYVYDPKTGEVKRIGIKAGVANQITKDMLDKKIAMDKIASKDTSSEQAIEQRLKSLMDEFLKFAKSRTIEAESSEQ